MEVLADAVSGPQPDNAGKVDGLDAALEKAMGPIDDGTDDFPPLHLKEAKSRQDKVAGDARTSEDASQPAPQGEAPDKAAAPTGNAEVIEAPNHWDAERKQAFAALKAFPEGQKAMLAMAKNLEGGFTRKSQELSDTAKFAEGVRGLFQDHHRQQLAHAGMDEVGAIRYLMQLQDYASQRPVEYIQWAMRSMGITPEHLGFNQRQQGQPQQQPSAQAPKSTGDPQLDALLADPETAKLRSEFGQFSQAALGEINALKQYIQRQEYQKQEHVQRQHLEGVNSIKRQWGDFRGAQDDHGQLAHPHADSLMQPMGALMDTHPVLRGMPDGPEKLAKAYEMALRADPELSKPVFEEYSSKKVAEQQKKAEAEKAKVAAKVRPATGAPTMPAKKGGLDAALESAFAALARD